MDDLYRDYILEHYRRPHNFGVLEAPTASFEGANPLCGDRITMQLGIRDGVVAEIAFTGRGCAISQASASLLTDEIMGMPVEKAEAFRADDLLELLGIEISPARLKCAMLSFETLEHALAETTAGGGETGPVPAPEPAPAATTPAPAATTATATATSATRETP
ncbi:MAG: Fe-S cluster assembly sulfur transfer protein SufU [Candidatus Limnocylindrales bacterium]